MGALSIVLVVALSAELSWCASAKDPLRAVLRAWPLGEHFYLGEPVSLRCEVLGNSSAVWSYRWFRHDSHIPAVPNPAHRVLGGTYSIPAMATSDRGFYWCLAEGDGKRHISLLSNAVTLNVSDSAPASLEVEPDSKQHFLHGQISLHCSAGDGNSSGWVLRMLSSAGVQSGCLQREGNVSGDGPARCHFSRVSSQSSGLYWCEKGTGDQRSHAINITVEDGDVILQSPALPVKAGESVTLKCMFRSHQLNHTSLYKEGIRLIALNETEVTVGNVTCANEGFYMCADPANVIKSPESWLTVRGNCRNDPIEGAAPAGGTWVWVLVVSVILTALFLILLLLLLAPRIRENFGFFTMKAPRGRNVQQEMPQTKQDVTEIQWDLAWMEMDNLLDRQQNAGS